LGRLMQAFRVESDLSPDRALLELACPGEFITFERVHAFIVAHVPTAVVLLAE